MTYITLLYIVRCDKLIKNIDKIVEWDEDKKHYFIRTKRLYNNYFYEKIRFKYDNKKIREILMYHYLLYGCVRGWLKLFSKGNKRYEIPKLIMTSCIYNLIKDEKCLIFHEQDVPNWPDHPNRWYFSERTKKIIKKCEYEENKLEVFDTRHNRINYIHNNVNIKKGIKYEEKGLIYLNEGGMLQDSFTLLYADDNLLNRFMFLHDLQRYFENNYDINKIVNIFKHCASININCYDSENYKNQNVIDICLPVNKFTKYMFYEKHLKLQNNTRQKFMKIIYTCYYLMNKININHVILQKIINKIL